MVKRIIKKRKSVNKFSDKKVDWRDIIKAIDMARYAPMAGNLFSLKFIITNDFEKIEKLTEASQQDFFLNAQYVVIVCSNPSKTLNAYGEKGEDYLRQQAGAAMQNFQLKLTDLGLSTCWVGHFVEEQVKKIFSIPEKINVEAFFPIGYESSIGKKKPKKKIKLDPILYFEKYGNKRMKK